MTFDIEFVTYVHEEDRSTRYRVEVLDTLLGMEAQAIPSPGDTVLIEGTTYRVDHAAWNYQEEHVRVVLRQVAFGGGR